MRGVGMGMGMEAGMVWARRGAPVSREQAFARWERRLVLSRVDVIAAVLGHDHI